MDLYIRISDWISLLETKLEVDLMDIKNISTKLLIVIALLAISFAVACSGPEPSGTTIPGMPTTTITATTLPSGEQLATQNMIKFNSIEEMKAFLQQSGSAVQTRDIMYKGGAMESVAMADSAVGVAPSAGASAVDYSTTNIQVAGVDEADFVKNDNRYIYLITDNKLLIVDAYDAKNAKIVSTTKISSTENTDYYYQPQGREIFINGNKLVLFVQTNEKTFYFQKYDIQPIPSYKQVTKAIIYDISDKASPKELESFTMPGSYYQSRMIKDKVYVVTQEGIDYNYIAEPMVKWSTGSIAPDIYYFDNPEQSYQLNTITSLDMTNEKAVDSMSLMLGYSNTLMVSEDNIYIAYQKQRYWRWWGYYGNEYDKERFYNVILPLLEGDIKAEIQNISQRSISEDEKWQLISEKLAAFYNKADSDTDLQAQYEGMFSKIVDALEEYDTKKALEDSMTVIQKIAIDDGKISYKAKGEVYGRLLNQFSLDEYESNLRVATTVDLWVKKRIEANNVYVLDKDMKTIGKLEGIGQDEQIYSTRFLGKRLYMVTYKQIDPFFVIDLSDPKSPKVLGALKIPGFSNYLHPYDENHIIGIGKDTTANELGGATTGGIKIALFDVTNVANPVEVDNVVIGDQGSDSAALHDHKAFLFSKDKNLLVIPVTEITRREQTSPYMWSNDIWTGAYVFHLDETGFKELGKAQHSSKRSNYWDWWSEATVMRSLYMDNNLYTISNKYIKINDLSNNVAELNSISLPYSSDHYYYWWR